MTTPDRDPNVLDGEIVDDTPTAAIAVPSPPLPEPDYSDGGVPSFDFVRDKIENRYTTSVGAAEVAGLGTEHTADALDKKIADRDQAAKDRLAEIRRSMRGE
ncbi:PspA/IM30 family protein [Amycolatopsis sp. cg9]|uniref:PspA/IM30 family protein n=1 Tax=Amycolatopsis sp. cg9 TaxID=3238801 RepID=UPI00352664EC